MKTGIALRARESARHPDGGGLVRTRALISTSRQSPPLYPARRVILTQKLEYASAATAGSAAEIIAAGRRVPTFPIDPRGHGVVMWATNAARLESGSTFTLTRASEARVLANLAGAHAPPSNKGRSVALAHLRCDPLSGGYQNVKGHIAHELRVTRTTG